MSVLRLSKSIPAAAVALVLAVGNPAVCAGWLPTAEARMACCSDNSCPMHQSDSPDRGSRPALTQAEADRCCAASDQDDLAPSSSSFVLSVSLVAHAGPVSLAPPDAEPAAHARLTPVPLLDTHVPKHLRLSVLLV